MTDETHRTNINLYRSDYEFLLAKYGYGWTRQVRDMVHEAVKELGHRSRHEPVFDNVHSISDTIDLEALIKAHNDE